MTDCAIEGCELGGRLKRGWCSRHYQRWKRSGDPLAGRRSPDVGASCSIDGCDAPHEAHGLCNRHYLRSRAHGDPLSPDAREVPRGLTLAQRFEAKFDRNGSLPERRPELGPCHLWTSALDGKGYGLIFVDGRSRRAHRVAWMLAGLELVEGLELDHLCNRRSCVRVDHLEQVTPAENTRRATEHLRWLRHLEEDRCASP